ncbi:hypothetical protein BG004_007019 [Podila humilis]|nr:hypothetical protein BG004_007019 [Podila humilis]
MDCVYSSIGKDPACLNLSTEIQEQLRLAFGGNNINQEALAAAIKNPRIKTCVCHWSDSAFTPQGSASTCATGTNPFCSASAISLVQAGIALVEPILKCNATAATSSTGEKTTTPTSTSSLQPSTKPNGATINWAQPEALSAVAWLVVAGLSF